MTAPFEHASEVREALHSIVADPEAGLETLASTEAAANLLRDLLPDAPREMSLLLAAISAGAPAMLRDYARQRMPGETAVSLTAAALAGRTAFTTEACQWAVSELAIALHLIPALPISLAGQLAPHPRTERAEPPAAPPVQPATDAARPDSDATPTTIPGPVRARQVRLRREHRPARLAPAVAGLLAAAVAGAGLYAVLHKPATPRSSPPGSASQQHGIAETIPAAALPARGAWIAQLASVSRSAGTAARNSALARVRTDVPGAQVLSSDHYASLRPGYWVIYYDRHFSSGIQALSYCAEHGLDTRNLCIGRYLSHNPADLRYQCYPPASAPAGICTRPPARSPARIVEAYITAVNQHNWAQVWALGGKNLGQTYTQLIAGYARTRHVQITSITTRGQAVTVLTTATETNGTAQHYRLTYLVSGATITAGQSTLISG